MDQITARDSRNLLRAVQTLNVSLDLSTLAQRTIAAVNHVVPADMVTYNEVDLVRRVDRIFVAPNDERLCRANHRRNLGDGEKAPRAYL